MKTMLATLLVASLAVGHALAIAEPQPLRGMHWFCGVRGESCVKRSADPEPRPAAWRFASGRVGFCGVPGESCVKLKRSAEAVRDALSDHWKGGDRPKTGAAALCNAPGEKCDVANQAIGDVSKAAEDAYHELLARSAAATKPKREAQVASPGRSNWFCGVPGESCGAKRRALDDTTGRPDGGAVASGAAALTHADPSYLSAECAKAGNECHSLLKAHAAFHGAKREVEAIGNLTSPKSKQAYCALYGCDADTEQYFRLVQSGDPEAERVEKDCHGEAGECTLAQQSLDALERSLDAAVARIA